MIVELAAVTKGRHGSVLPETSLRFGTGRPTLIEAETEQRPTVLGLLATGRMRADAGTVLIDGARDNRQLRARLALVDAPGVSEPASNVSLRGVVSEELMFAGLPAGPRAVAQNLCELGVEGMGSWPMSTISPGIRVRVLTELALLRSGVDGVVIVSPDRHGGHPDQWWATAHEVASRGKAVLVIVGHSAVVALGASATHTPMRGRRPRVSSPLGRSRKAHS